MDTSERHFTFLRAGGRPGGNTEALSRRAAAGLPTGTVQRWLDLNDLALPPFQDRRHDDSAAAHVPTGHERTLIDATLLCTDLVIVSPVYWGGLAAPGKLYLDHVVNWVRLPGLKLRSRMRGKTLWGVAVLNGPGHDDAKPMADLLESAADYLNMHFGGLLLGNGDRPGDVLNDARGIEEADRFFSPPKDPAPSA
ncbi:flavodoxin family protein [Kitasatospora sp. NPDC093550]|uniref:flavodoxin family protein n=1 Tax=Kitasatospora sp. NPDC093550 TaxID=3364089 RepID=UPI0037F73B85